MKSIKNVFTLLLAFVLTLAMSSAVFAESQAFPGGDFTYNGEEITFEGDEASISQAISGLEPGDTVTIKVTYTNNHSEDTDWYLKNDVIKTLEESGDAAKNGGYSYVLTNKGVSGTAEIYNSDNVGGEDTNGGEGLHKATQSTDEWFYIDTLPPGKSGSTTLKVSLEGETEVNTYQETAGELALAYAVENEKGAIIKKVPKTKYKYKDVPGKPRVIDTGDIRNLLPTIGVFLGALVLLILAILSYRKDRKEGEEA